MNDCNWYQVFGWMGNRLGLRGNELICFSIIYGFSQDGESQFKGNLDYLTDMMFCTRPTTLLCLNKLMDLDLISKEEAIIDGKKRCYYSTKVLFVDGHIECLEDAKSTSKESLPKTSKETLPKTSKESLPNKDNIYNNKENNNKLLSKKRSCFEKPTVEQIEAYIREKGLGFDAEHFFDYNESKGWVVGKSPMKDWKAACRTWQHNNRSREMKEEKEETDEIPDNTYNDEKFQKQQKWMQKHTPKIADKITLKMMNWFRERSFCDGNTLIERLKELNEAYDGGDIVQLFKKMYLS